MRTAQAIQGGPSTFWMRCSTPNCHTYYNTAVPMPHQDYALRDSSKRIGLFGGYGSGKTFTGYQGDQKHITLTPNGETLIGADTLVQLDNTVKKDLEKDFPIEFVHRYNRQKNSIQFVNGHILYYRPLADQGDIRSYNLTRVHILEASEVKHESYVQLQTRLRNENAIRHYHENGAPIMKYNPNTHTLEKKERLNWIQMIVESNPDAGWIKEDFVLKSGRIYIHHDTNQKYHVDPEAVNPTISSHIIPSKANFHLPHDFISNLEKGKPKWWVNRYLYGSFDYSEGMVYPHFADAIIEDFDIPKHWPRVVGMDYGLNDNTHFIFGAIDQHGEMNNQRPAVYFFAEIARNDLTISQLAQLYKQGLRQHVPPNSLYRTPVMDGRSYSQRERTGEKKTIGTLFKNEGCVFKPAQMDLEARIMKLNDLIDSGQAYFFKRGTRLANEEFKKYRYPDKKLESSSKANKPIDKDNHGINATEFICMELPYKLIPTEGGVHTPYKPTRHVQKKAQKSAWDIMDEGQEEYEGFAKFFD